MSIDVSTACHLGVCIALRLSEAVPLVNVDPERNFRIKLLELALKKSGLGKKSNQRFLKSSSTDDFITKGAGGNTIPYKCFIIKQNAISFATVELLRKGMAIATPILK